MIKTALHQYKVAMDGNYKTHLRRLCIERAQPIPKDETDGTPAIAEIIRGNWVAGCPSCNGYIVIEPGEDYFCPDCNNASNGGKWRPIEWPNNKTAIENVLNKRPDPLNRNWLIGETIQDLKNENIAHAVEE